MRCQRRTQIGIHLDQVSLSRLKLSSYEKIVLLDMRWISDRDFLQNTMRFGSVNTVFLTMVLDDK